MRCVPAFVLCLIFMLSGVVATGASATQPPTPIVLGVPAGDAYTPTDLAIDPARRLAYVASLRGPEDTPVVSVVDLDGAQVTRLIDLPAERGSEIRLLLSPDGKQGFAVDRTHEILTLFDPLTGKIGERFQAVYDAALDPAGETLYVVGNSGLTALSTANLHARWQVAGRRFVDVAADGERVAVVGGGEGNPLMVFDASTGRQTAQMELPNFAQGLAGGPDGSWAVRVATSPSRLLRLGPDLQILADSPAPSGDGIFYDAPRKRYLLSGFSAEADYRSVLTALAQDDLAVLAEETWSWEPVPNVLAGFDGSLLSLTRYASPYLNFVDPASLRPVRRAALGVGLTDMALDEGRGILFVADNQDRIHVISTAGGSVSSVWDGRAPIALDPANGRLYVNRPAGVVALDVTNGRLLAEYPQGGVPAPDPERNLVYIVDGGVTVFDRDGRQVGRLASTFPQEHGFVPNPYAVGARVNPANGYLVVLMNNSIPGSNNSTYLQIYPPNMDRPVHPPGRFSFVADVAFDPQNGNILASYSAARNLEALQLLSGTGEQEIGRLSGRTGGLALDTGADLAYVAYGNVLSRVALQSMFLEDIYRLPGEVSQIALDSRTGRLYARSENRSRIEVLDTQALPLPNSRPQPLAGLPEQPFNTLRATEDRNGLLLFGTTSDGLFRSRDGKRWDRLSAGSLPAFPYLTVAGTEALFYSGWSYGGGEGVWRSLDAGDSWELLAKGLNDLRPRQEVQSRDAGHAYFVSRTSGIFAWEPEQEQWRLVRSPRDEYGDVGRLSLAPDGTLFLLSWSELLRSEDGGRNWQSLQPPANGGIILGFGDGEGRSPTIFALFGATSPQLMRSTDGAETWQPAGGGINLAGLSFSGLTLVPDRQTLYLYYYGYTESLLYRSLDGGESWQQTDTQSVAGTTAMAVAPDGTIWLALTTGGVRAQDPARLRWSPVPDASTPTATVAPVPTTTPLPAPAPTPPPPPAPTPCALALSGYEADLAQEIPELGCPQDAARQVPLARQHFVNGQMFWLGDEKTILVLFKDATWHRLPDTWQEGQAESDPTLAPPPGLYQPVRGFGKVWREQLGGPEARIGWAVEEERAATAAVQQWDGGLVLRLGNQESYVLLNNGFWR